MQTVQVKVGVSGGGLIWVSSGRVGKLGACNQHFQKVKLKLPKISRFKLERVSVIHFQDSKQESKLEDTEMDTLVHSLFVYSLK